MPDNKLYYGDNLPILRNYIKDESVDLIYLDPPFNSKANYNILYQEPSGEQSQAQITAFEDSWHWTEEAERTFQKIIETAPPAVVEMMNSFRSFVGVNDMMAYLTMMAIRLLELRRVLKSTGSIYLHCDPTASHYLKVLMDTIFGKKNFRNEIIWKRTPFSGSSKARAQQLPRSHDVILFYTKSLKWVWNTPTEPYTDKYLKRFKWDDKDGRGAYRKTLLKTYSSETFERLKKENRLIAPVRPGAKYSYKQYLRESSGTRQIDDVWTDINSLNPVAQERLGYPTQKPVALLERIISASSNEGDVILDPFCGCGTTITASQKLRRKWIGIDVTHLAINLIKWRLKDMFGLQPKKDYDIVGEPEDITGARELASQNRYQFQWWALSLINARPYQDKKMGSDSGIDGLIYFQHEKNRVQKAIVQVKSGHVSVSHIRDLGHVIDREKAEIGIFITLETPTSHMIKEAVQKGFYKSPIGNRQYPKIQIRTIEDLLKDNRLDIPTAHISHKKAEATDIAKQVEMDI